MGDTIATATPSNRMWTWIDAAVDLVALNPHAALGVVFLAAIIEAVAVLGIIIPGTPILMAVAGAAAMAGQPMAPFLALSIVGAVLGDFFSFWLGTAVQRPVARRMAIRALADDDGQRRVVFRPLWLIQRRAVPVRAGAKVHRAAGRRHGGHAATAVCVGQCRIRLCLGAMHIYPAQLAGLSLGRLRDGDWQSGAMWGGGPVGRLRRRPGRLHRAVARPKPR